MKKINVFLLATTFIPFLFNCGGKSVKVVTTGQFCTFENKTSTGLNQDFSIAVNPYTGYELSSSCFNIKINNNDVTTKSNCWTFSNNTLKIDKSYVVGDIAIVGSATKKIETYNVTVNYDDGYIEPYGGSFPSTCKSNEDLTIKFNLIDKNYGLDSTVIINDQIFNDYEVRDEGDYVSLKINSADLIGNVSITLEANDGKISFSQNKVSIHNYDTISVFYSSPLGGTIDVSSPNSSAFTVEHDSTNNRIDINSTSDAICDDIEITVTTTASTKATNSFTVSVYHPTNVDEALNAVTLAFLRGKNNFDVTFNYYNNESFDTFADHLEITENMYYSSSDGKGLSGKVYTGTGKTNTFSLNGLDSHGRGYATDTTITTTEYPEINCANAVITENECSGTSTLEIDKSNKTIKVYNSEELFWAVEHGYLPTFDSETSNGQNAETIYNKARAAVIANTTDAMDVKTECINLFNYLENLISYDYVTAESSAGYPDWLKYKSYFLDGVFLNNGIAVCDGFSKAYALLCGLDNLPVIRSFGYTSSAGHAWNYVKIDGSWYLVCPTWAKATFDYSEETFYGESFSIFTYNSFAKSNSYFYDASGGSYNFSDLAFPSISRSIVNSSINVLKETEFTYKTNTCNFVISSTADMTNVANKCYSLGLKKGTSFYVILDGRATNFETYLRKGISASSLSDCKWSCYVNSDYSECYLLFK